MDNLTYLKNSLRKHWTVWSAIGTPLLLSSSGYSGMDMKRELGYGYSEFLYNFQNCWGGDALSDRGFKKDLDDYQRKPIFRS